MMKAFWTGLAVGAFISAPALGGEDAPAEAAPASPPPVSCDTAAGAAPTLTAETPCPLAD